MGEMPVRIQRKRTKGWRMPEGAVYVGRPTTWGNPYLVGRRYGGFTVLSVKDAVASYRRDIEWNERNTDRPMNAGIRVDDIRRDLRGKDLVCWCPLDQPCHADVLLELANEDAENG